MSDKPPSKHAERSANTRQQFIDAALALYAQRSIDSVSVNEVTIAAGQKNRNALQYHFGNRDGLIQAIVDQHSAKVRALRKPLLDALGQGSGSAKQAAYALVQPLITYAEQCEEGVHYVKLLSQLAAISSPTTNPGGNSALSFEPEEKLTEVFDEAIAHLSKAEAGRRLFLVVTMTFHGIADICRAHDTAANPSDGQRSALFRQVTAAVEATIRAPALEEPDTD